MPLEWKTSRIGGYEITHWKKQDPQKLLDAVKSRPLKEAGGNPAVTVHAFGSQQLAVRIADPELFDRLRATVERKAALVEMPVAKIVRAENAEAAGRILLQPVIIATLWKKGTRPFNEFLKDPAVSPAAKETAGLRVMKLLAKLHDRGFEHGHAHAENFVVDGRGSPSFVDYTLLRAVKSKSTPAWESDAASESIALNLDEANFLKSLKKVAENPAYHRRRLYAERIKLRNKLLDAYREERKRLDPAFKDN